MLTSASGGVPPAPPLRQLRGVRQVLAADRQGAGAAGFCCYAGAAGDVCTTCFKNAIAASDSYCATGKEACTGCGATWCE